MNSTIVIRLAITALLIAGAFVFPFLIVLAAFVAWTVFKDLTEPKKVEPDPWFARRWTATANDPDWKSYFLPFCESPAEIAFLEAMIDQYELVPDGGLLTGQGLTLNLQVKMDPYRVDFLAEKWLVIEIDGAAYHSSPEAVARDRARDEFLEAKGCRVLRIPARVVFNAPNEAVGKVRAAVAKGPMPIISDPARQFSLRQTFSVLGKAVSDVNDFVKSAQAVQIAMNESRSTFDMERAVVDGAIEHAQHAIRIAEFRNGNAEWTKIFDDTYEDIISRFPPDQSPSTMCIRVIEAPATLGDASIDETIKRAYQDLMEERSSYLAAVRLRLRADRRLADFVKAHLQDAKLPNVWSEIS